MRAKKASNLSIDHSSDYEEIIQNLTTVKGEWNLCLLKAEGNATEHSANLSNMTNTTFVMPCQNERDKI